MPHPAVLFSCFCSLCILHLKNIRTGRSILVNDISDGLQQRFVQRIAVFLLFFASHKNAGAIRWLDETKKDSRLCLRRTATATEITSAFPQ